MVWKNDEFNQNHRPLSKKVLIKATPPYQNSDWVQGPASAEGDSFQQYAQSAWLLQCEMHGDQQFWFFLGFNSY